MQITRAPRTSHFTVLPNEVIENDRLSWRARGILAYLLSRPDNWSTSAERLATQGKEGRDAIRTALNELEAVGYLRRSRVRGTDGTLSTQVAVFDTPQPTTGNPASVNQPSVSQASLTRTDTKNLLTPASSVVGDTVESPAPRVAWRPSDRAMQSAQSQTSRVDLGLLILKYETWCHKKGRTPDSADWLTWAIRDEEQAIAAERKERAESEKPRPWHETA